MKFEIDLPEEAEELLEEIEEQAPLAREQIRNEVRGQALDIISTHWQQLQQMREQQAREELQQAIPAFGLGDEGSGQ